MVTHTLAREVLKNQNCYTYVCQLQNTHYNEEEFVVPVMLMPVPNIILTTE